MAKGGTIKPPETLEEIEACEDEETIQKWLDQECVAWDDAGMHTQKVQIDMFQLDLQQNTLIQYLVDKGIIDLEEINKQFRKNILIKMRAMRDETEPRLREARLNALKASIMPPQIFGPNGQKLGGDM